MTVDGTDLRDMGAVLSQFSEELPEPKVIKVDIPAGVDRDITEALGAIGYHNGRHTLTHYVVADTEAERVRMVREIVAMLHGSMHDYKLSWDSGYTYTGRFQVSVERLNPRSSRVTVDVDRSPWKKHSKETVTLDCHPSATHALEGSVRYHDIVANYKQAGTAKLGSAAAVATTAGNNAIATDSYGDKDFVATVNDWLLYVDGEDLVVKNSKFSTSGSDAVIDATYEINLDRDDMVFTDVASQKVTLTFYRWDL